MASATDTERQATNSRLLAELLASSQRPLLRQARKHAQLETDAEEALQAACAIFLEKYHPPAEPLPWLMTTIKHEAWGLAKRSYRRRELAIAAVPCKDGQGTVDLTDCLVDPGSGPAEAAESRELLGQRRAALARLKPDQRTALLLLGLGYSYAEIGELRGWSMRKVERGLVEGRAALRGAL